MSDYNLRVRQAISEEYVKAQKQYGRFLKELEVISVQLANDADKLTYKEYLNLKDKASCLRQKSMDLSTEIDIWDKAREICLDVADEW